MTEPSEVTPSPTPPVPAAPGQAPVPELEQPPAAAPEETAAPINAADEPVAGQVVDEGSVPKHLPRDWPRKGYHGPQPWEVDEPPALTHGHGFIASGEAGEDVELACRLLAYAGYETSVSRGENPLAVWGESERQAVDAFRRDYGIEEDPAVVSATVTGVVGPWTWEALYRVGRRPAAEVRGA